jgi:hypothetical protein
MKISNSRLRSAFAAAVIAAVCGNAGPVFADKIKMRDGKEYNGTITAEDGTSVTIKYQLTPTIPDFKTIPRSEIVSIEKQTPEDLDASKVKALLPTDDFLLPSDYRKLIESGPDRFTATYPQSKYRAEMEKIKATLQDEMAKARRGMRKVDGKWLGALELNANEYNITTLKNLRTMEKLAKADRYREAMLAFHDVEGSGKFSVNYPKAIDLARAILDKYGAQLGQMAKDVPTKLKQREEDLKTLTEDQIKTARAERDRIKKEFTAQIAEEKKIKLPFNSVSDVELASIQEAQKQVTAEQTRLAALKRDEIAESARGYERILKLIGEKKYEEAAVRLDEFIKTDKGAGADKDIKNKVQELKKLRENELRDQRLKELQDRRPTEPPKQP